MTDLVKATDLYNAVELLKDYGVEFTVEQLNLICAEHAILTGVKEIRPNEKQD